MVIRYSKIWQNYSNQDICHPAGTMITKNEFENNVLSGILLNYESIWDNRQPVFDIMPKDFLRFAEESLSNDDIKNLVNSLTNTKRALDSKIELIIREYGYGKKMNGQRWKFPQKIQFLKEKGIIAPRILEKINKTRNSLEHEFKRPNPENVKDALDIVALFIGYTEQLKRVPDRIRLGFDPSTTTSYVIRFQKDGPAFEVLDGKEGLFSIEEGDASFERLIKLFHGSQPASWSLIRRSDLEDKHH